MITIHWDELNVRHHFKVKDLIDLNWKRSMCAFVGKIGHGPEHSLYLISFNSIILAIEPNRTWSDVETDVEVDYFANLDISITKM